jgi:hypothetical protein
MTLLNVAKAICRIEPDRPLYSVPKYRLFPLEIKYFFHFCKFPFNIQWTPESVDRNRAATF